MAARRMISALRAWFQNTLEVVVPSLLMSAPGCQLKYVPLIASVWRRDQVWMPAIVFVEPRIPAPLNRNSSLYPIFALK